MRRQEKFKITRDELANGLVHIGEMLMTGKDESEVDAYYAPEYKFHGTDGREWDYKRLKGYFSALRAAFETLTIKRNNMIVEGNSVACQTTITGTFVHTFTHSPVGTLPPNGKSVVFELMNIFRYDEKGRLVEEWIQTDSRNVLQQLSKSEI